MSVTGETFRNTRNGKVYAVTDLSAGGFSLRLIEAADLLLYPAGGEVQGRLRLRDLDEPVPVHAKVRRVERDRIGLEFVSANDRLERVLADYLAPARLGRMLRRAPGGTIDCFWYRGGAGADLWVWPARGVIGSGRESVDRWVLRAHGMVVSWERGEGSVVTGAVVDAEARALEESEEEWGLLHFESLEIRRDEVPDADKMRIAKAILVSCNEEDSIRFACAEVLSGLV